MFQEENTETWTQQGIQWLKHFLDVMCEWPWIMRTPTIYLVIFRAIQWEFYGICLIVSLVLLQLFLYFYAKRSKMHEDLSAHSNAMVCGVFCFCSVFITKICLQTDGVHCAERFESRTTQKIYRPVNLDLTHNFARQLICTSQWLQANVSIDFRLPSSRGNMAFVLISRKHFLLKRQCLGLGGSWIILMYLRKVTRQPMHLNSSKYTLCKYGGC